jgi:hypothetical protein
VGDDKPNTSALGKCVTCGVGLALHTLFISFILLLMSGKFSPNRFLDRIASQTIAACAASVAPSISHNHKLTSHHYQQTHVVLSTTRRDLCKLRACLRTSIPKRRRHNNTTFSNPNVPLQTRGHALAGISGMLRSLAGAQGAFTSRGAKP